MHKPHSKVIEAHGEIEMADAIHTLSMSDKPAEAAYGRGLKELLPALNSWMDGECERNYNTSGCCEHHITMGAAANLFPQLLALMINRFAREGKQGSVYKSTAKIVNTIMEEHAKELAELDAKASERRSMFTGIDELLQLIKSMPTTPPAITEEDKI